jgi:alcohol dehydrogenase class IV
MAATQCQAESENGAENERLGDAIEAALEHMNVQAVRAWMSDAGVPRPRAATKRESLEAAAERDPEALLALADKLGGGHAVECGCGMRVEVGHELDAENLARAHKSNKPQHFPTARGPDGERIYG